MNRLGPQLPLEPIVRRPSLRPDDVEGLDVRGADRAAGFAFNGDRRFQRGVPAVADFRQRALRDADARRELGLRDAVGFQVWCEFVFHAPQYA